MSPQVLQQSEEYVGGNLQHKVSEKYNGIRFTEVDCEIDQENSNASSNSQIINNKKILFELMNKQNKLYKENLQLEKQVKKVEKPVEAKKVSEESKMKFMSA